MTEFVCTKETPYVKGTTIADKYVHPSASWTDRGSDYWDEYLCPICGVIWQEEVAE